MVYALRVFDLPLENRLCLVARAAKSGWRNNSTSHQHPVNRLCHTFGIPIILLSLGIGVAALVAHWLWIYALGLFLFGWALQFIGHAFERKLPEFFHDWRFLFVGVRWWWGKAVGGRKSEVGGKTSDVGR
jgi:uncharacterized membrane protein YGL010W